MAVGDDDVIAFQDFHGGYEQVVELGGFGGDEFGAGFAQGGFAAALDGAPGVALEAVADGVCDLLVGETGVLCFEACRPGRAVGGVLGGFEAAGVVVVGAVVGVGAVGHRAPLSGVRLLVGVV